MIRELYASTLLRDHTKNRSAGRPGQDRCRWWQWWRWRDVYGGGGGICTVETLALGRRRLFYEEDSQTRHGVGEETPTGT